MKERSERKGNKEARNEATTDGKEREEGGRE